MAFDINQVFLIGRLTRDPETRFSSNTAICKFSIANNSGREDKDVNFFDVVVFGKTAENIQQYLKKGSQIAISGRLSQSRWEKDGQKRSKVEIVGLNIQFLDTRGGGGGSSGSSYSGDNKSIPNNEQQPYDNSNATEITEQQDDFDDTVEDADDIPF